MRSTTKITPAPPLHIVHSQAAGIDIGSREHYVAVAPDADPQPVRTFGCTTPDLLAMGEWLKAAGVRTVAMESTGVYWVPVARVLEDLFGLEVILVDAKQVRCVPGRKTDVKDCQWLQQLHSYGLLSAVFRPAPPTAPLKTYARHRKSLVEASAQHIQRMQKALEVMNVQLHKVLTDITGMTGMKILRAIVAGQRDPVALAQYRDRRVKHSADEIAKALTGNYLPEQIFVLQEALASFDFVHEQMQRCDAQIQAFLTTLQSDVAHVDAGAGKACKRRKNQPHFDLRRELVRILGVDLTAIPGIDALTAHTVISEIGTDVAKFPTEKHFASWLTLSPNHQITGGRVRRRRTRPGANRVATALRVAAQSLSRSRTALGAFFRRVRARIGAPKAVTAAARKLAVLIYRMLKYGKHFVELGQQAYENAYQHQVLDRLTRTAKQFGLRLVPVSDAPPGGVS